MCKSTTNFHNEQTFEGFFEVSGLENKVEVGFTAPDLSSLGGMLVLKKIAAGGIIDQLCSCIQEWRDVRYVQHSIREMVTQRVMQIAAGYEDADDCDLLRGDSMLKMAAGRKPSDDDLCSQPTMSRLENHVGRSELWEMGEVFVKHFIASYDKEPVKIVLDLDDSNFNCYGAQQLCLFNNYYGEFCYMPLFIFEGYSGKLVLPLLRPGRTNKRTNVFGLLKRLITELRRHWKNTVITVRGDAMFCSYEFMEWAQTQPHLHYVVGLTGNSVLRDEVQKWVDFAEERYAQNHEDIREYHRICYRAKSWNRHQWVMVKIERNFMGSNVRYVVTDQYKMDPKDVYERRYCKRGICELLIKEVKNGLCSDRMSCSSFAANQFRLFLHAAAYVLLLEAREKLFAGTEFQDVTIITFRERILLSAVRITELKTKIKVEFGRGHPYRYELKRALRCA